MRLKVVLFKESDIWVAQCIDDDMATQGQKSSNDIVEVIEGLGTIFDARDVFREKNPHDISKDLKKAPDQYFTLFKYAEPLGIWKLGNNRTAEVRIYREDL
jgi:hypothetical protein